MRKLIKKIAVCACAVAFAAAGILAGKLAEKYDSPAFVITDSEKEGYIKGSVRTACDINIKELLDILKVEE